MSGCTARPATSWASIRPRRPPRLALPDDSRPIAEPYVCIAVQSTTQSKYWNNPHGWREIVRFLKASGYRVICIDQKPVHGTGLVWNHIPHGAEDETGDRPLAERARWLRHAEFFVGLRSGLSWLAWAAGTPVVLISGFTHPTNEFATPYRVINWHACNGCWNDVRHPLRPQGLSVVPAPCGHAAAVRMHAADHGRSRQSHNPTYSRFRRPQGDGAGSTR